MAKDRPETTVQDQPMSDRERQLLALLEAKEAELAKAQQALDEANAAETSGLRVRTEAGGPFRGEGGGWLFRIAPLNRDKFPHLPVVEQRACDESEMIRWYCATHQDPPKSGKQVDPVKVTMKVECLDEGRNKLLWRKQMLATIRSKLGTGTQLTQKEQDLLAEHESEVMGHGPV